ncbi:hypothetical protein NOR_05136 [Metarhizium rileyi]|uniref:Uncharacterized protein n=1 Tax=Metarhizium rileyi (strain RCEF 4871) TaxID=1649241 RepID=A0A162JAI0_METRR|nr:hypothetical protein NOR_05136 [Metarhizium rileyi RCEF 4871]
MPRSDYSPHKRDRIVSAFDSGMTGKEIAEKEGVPLPTVDYETPALAQEEIIERLKIAIEEQTRRADEERCRADEEWRLREQEMRVHAEQDIRAINAALQREREEHNKTTHARVSPKSSYATPPPAADSLSRPRTAELIL